LTITFDYASSFINVPQADAQPLTVQTLVNTIRQEEASERGIVEPSILAAVGKDDLGSSVFTGITASLRNQWKLKFAAGSYQATVTGGNLSDALNRIINTGSPQVLVLSSAAATVITGDGSGSGSGSSTFPTVSEIAAGVWDEILESNLTARQLQLLVAAELLGSAMYYNGVWIYNEDVKDKVFGSQTPLDKGISAANIDIKSKTVQKTNSSAGGVDRVVVSTKKVP